MNKIETFLSESKTYFEENLRELISKNISSRESFCEKILHYSLQSGGKRIRPALIFCSADVFGVAKEKLLDFAMAVEILHTATLIHDDLPSVDDDDLRRGVAAAHIKYGEGQAIMAGDYSFFYVNQIILESVCSNEIKQKLLHLLSLTGKDICEGQLLDLENYLGKEESPEGKIAEVMKRYELKTARLIETSLLSPLVFKGYDSNSKEWLAVKTYAKNLGLIFQVTDDLIERNSSEKEIGKRTNSDNKRDLDTLADLMSAPELEELLGNLETSALESIQSLGEETKLLSQFLKLVISRTS